ncbi:MAG: hypothetical protein D3910_00985 [Candidatus Electrothrix sp. ATG2]|nr:hypothetical protein [Candidatus Electrothrix sp. ATG2]
MEFVIIRPPLVYGPNAPGNLGFLLRVLKQGIPLPLGAIHNKRCFVALDNLVDLIVTCLDHSAADNQIFLVGDKDVLSTTEFLRCLGQALEKPAHLLPVPQKLLKFGLKVLGKEDIGLKLCSSMQIDISKAKDLLDWEPVVTVEEALKKIANAYLEEKIT